MENTNFHEIQVEFFFSKNPSRILKSQNSYLIARWTLLSNKTDPYPSNQYLASAMYILETQNWN